MVPLPYFTSFILFSTVLRLGTTFQHVIPPFPSKTVCSVPTIKETRVYRTATSYLRKTFKRCKTLQFQSTMLLASSRSQEHDTFAESNEQKEQNDPYPERKLEWELKRYQNRSAILEHALKEKTQQVKKFERRIAILQDLVLRLGSEPSAKSTTGEKSPLAETKSAPDDSDSTKQHMEVEQLELQLSEKKKAYQESLERLASTGDKLRSRITDLERLLQNQEADGMKLNMLQEQLRKEQASLAKEREKRERDQRNFEKELQAANQETLKIESILFSMEKELKTRQEEFEGRENTLQDDLEKERKNSRKLRMNLQTVQEELKSASAVSIIENNSSNVKTAEAVEIAEAAVRAYEVREASLLREISTLDEKLRQALTDKDALKDRKNELKLKLRDYETKISKLENKIRVHDRKYLEMEEALRIQLDGVAKTALSEEGVVQMLQGEKGKLTELLMSEKRLRFADLEKQRSHYEQLIKEERRSLELQIELLENRLSKAEHRMLKGEETANLSREKMSIRRRLGNMLRRLSDGPKTVFKKATQSKT